MADRPHSEQDEELELDTEPARDDPAAWDAADPDQAPPPGPTPESGQFTTPDGAAQPDDQERTEIAEAAGTTRGGGPEQEAVRVEDEGDERGGRVWR